VEEIQELPVAELAERDAHLYLWTMNRHIEDAYKVVRAWGFKPSTLLVWAKMPRGLGLGGQFTISAEYILFARRGSLAPLQRVDRTWWSWKRPYNSRGAINSAKPDGFQDLVESVSPGPYLELFARRQRLGWDTWGDEALNHVDLSATKSAELSA
jgi:N6-adenosine-specific RNA methylase IME4